MAITTTTTWGEGFTAELKAKWDEHKMSFINEQIDAGKVPADATPLQTGTGGTRTWTDTVSANGWKTLAEQFATENGITVEVTLS